MKATPTRRRIAAKGQSVCGALAASWLLSSLIFLSPALAQSGGDFKITRSTIDAGGSTERPLLPEDPMIVGVRGTIGQPDASISAFGNYYLTGGLWATQGRTGVFFVDDFESGDTSAWTLTVGALTLGPATLGSPSPSPAGQESTATAPEAEGSGAEWLGADSPTDAEFMRSGELRR